LPPVDAVPAPGPLAPPAAAPGTIPNILPEVAPEAAPGTEPDPLDPFGAAPSPPNWMVENATFTPLPPVNVQPAVSQPPAVQDGPNLHGDDAPPTLPPALQGLLGSARAVRPVTAAAATTNVALQLPASVRTSDLIMPAATAAPAPTVMQASAEVPLGIQLINPATAVTPEAGAEGLQQAIYFEASDQDAAAPLPPVQQ
jgi:hypothetical protein